MTKPQPIHLAIARQIADNKVKLLTEIDLALTHAVQGITATRSRLLQMGTPRSSDGANGLVRQGLRVLGIDPTDSDELRMLKRLGDRILDNPDLYSTVIWRYYCAGYISFSECAECREKGGDRKRFFSEGQEAIERRFTDLVNQRGCRPPRALKS